MKPEILFVDDEADVLRGLRRSLRSQRNEWCMRFANGGAEAIDMLGEKEAHIIVTDMRMPDIDGASLLVQAAERWPATARVVLSGQADSDSVRRVVGVSHQFLAKPCDTDKLISTLKALSAGMVSEQQSRVVVIQALPTPKTTVEELLATLSKDGDDATAAARIIGDDLGLSAKMLQLSNSAYFGTGNGTLLPGDAVRTLGADLLRTLLENEASGFVDHIAEATPVHEEVRFVTELSKQLARLADDAINAAPDMVANPILFRQVCKFLPLGRLLGCLTGAKPTCDAQLGTFFMDLWGFPEELKAASKLVWSQPDQVGKYTDDQASLHDDVQAQYTSLARANVDQIATCLQQTEVRR